MPLAPLAVALVAVAIARATGPERPASARRAAVTLVLVLAAWSGLFAVLLWRDPQAANDSGLLLARSTYADGDAYIPSLFIRRWADAAPGLAARIAAWLLGIVWLAWGLRAARSPARALAGLALGILVLALALERWPGRRTRVADPDALPAVPGIEVAFAGAVRVREDEVILGPGAVRMRVRDTRAAGEAPRTALRATVGGEGHLLVAGLPPIRLRPTGGVVDLPLLNYHVVSGRDGQRVLFSRLDATVSGQAVMRFGPGEGTAPIEPAASGAEDESDQAAEPEDPGSR
jgi:hypothetical protein